MTRPFRELVEALSPARQEQIAAKTELLMEIERLRAENAALRENESRLAFHVVPELEEQLRAADKLADATEEHVECSTCSDSDCCARAVDHRDAREAACLALRAYLTARGKK